MAGTKRRLGAVLMGASLAGALVLAGPAMAQEEPEEVEVEATRHALLAHPINDALPDTLVQQFPPQVLCLVYPPSELREAFGDNEPLCGEVTNEEREQVRENVLEPVDTNQQTSPLQPAQPETLVMEFLAGSPRYSSAVTFDLPTIPDGEEWDEFTLTIPQTDLTYSIDSPMFQQAVFATVATAGTQDPSVFQEQMANALEEEPARQPQLGIEACPLLAPVPEDAAPPQSASIDTLRDSEGQDADDEDGNQNDVRQLQVECLVGANGKFDEDAGTWTFDLTSAARSWAGTGFTDLEMHGIYLRPTGAPNLAFGDPDTSTNGRITLDVSAAMTATVASSEPPDLGSFEGFDSGGDGGGGFEPADDQGGGSTGGFETSVSSPATSSSDTGSLDSQGGQTAPPAEVAPDDSAEEPAVALEPEPAGAPSTGWRVWLLLPLFALGAWLMIRSLTEDVAASGAAGGAMTRLVRGSA